jgi:hypothetical protein
MHEEYVARVRERLAEGHLLDAAFDRLLPLAERLKSGRHWTPVGVARMVARRLEAHGARYVLDAGSGAGKFCAVAAGACPALTFVGVEQHAALVGVANELVASLELCNVHFEQGDALARSWRDFDGFYFFNPFAENVLFRPDHASPMRTVGAPPRFPAGALRVAQRLSEARLGSVIVTYHGLGGPIPSSYELVSEESSGSGSLRTWRKTRAEDEAWLHLDDDDVTRASRQELEDACLGTCAPQGAN